MKEDKIFNNSFNRGDIEYEVFSKLEIHDKFKPDDEFEAYVNGEIDKELYDLFCASDFYDTYSTSKKVSKSDVTKVYYYYDDNLKNSKSLSPVDKFIAIADFMSISYDVLYEELGPSYKEKLLQELDNKFGVFKKHHIRRLF